MKKILFILLPVILISYVSNFSFISNDFTQQTQYVTLPKANSSSNISSGTNTPRLSFDGKTLPVSEFNHHRNLLSPKGQQTYDQIYNGAINGKLSIPITTNVYYTEIEDIIHGLIYDCPELFWLEGGFSYNWNNNKEVISVELKPNKLFNNLEANKQNFEKVANNVLQDAVNLYDDYEKVKYIHDHLVKTIGYVNNAPYNQSTYSGVVLNKTVCAGYAKAFQYYMIRLGIPCAYVSGTTDESHAWNIVKINGEYYNIDVTWDDPVGNPQNIIYYNYFNLTDKEISVDHKRSAVSQKLPKCTATADNYYVRNGKLFNTTSEFVNAAVDALTKSNANSSFSARLTNQTSYDVLKVAFQEYDWYDMFAVPVANNLGIKPQDIEARYQLNDSNFTFEITFLCSKLNAIPEKDTYIYANNNQNNNSNDEKKPTNSEDSKGEEESTTSENSNNEEKSTDNEDSKGEEESTTSENSNNEEKPTDNEDSKDEENFIKEQKTIILVIMMMILAMMMLLIIILLVIVIMIMKNKKQ